MLNEYVKKKRKKEKMHTQRHACKGMSKKETKIMIAHSWKYQRRKSHAKELIHESPNIVHTLAHLDQTV